jgi:hypothetical protein
LDRSEDLKAVVSDRLGLELEPRRSPKVDDSIIRLGILQVVPKADDNDFWTGVFVRLGQMFSQFFASLLPLLQHLHRIGPLKELPAQAHSPPPAGNIGEIGSSNLWLGHRLSDAFGRSARTEPAGEPASAMVVRLPSIEHNLLSGAILPVTNICDEIRRVY